MIFVRFLAPLALTLGLIAYLLLPWADRMFLSWTEADLQTRSRLVFASIEDDMPEVLKTQHTGQLTRRFTQMAKDGRLIGMGYCAEAGAPKYSNKDFPVDLPCAGSLNLTEPKFERKIIKGGPVMVAMFPVVPLETQATAQAGGQATEAAAKSGYMMIVHDMAYAGRRSVSAQRYILWFVFGVSLLAAFITMVVARITLSRWVVGLRDYVRTGKRTRGLPREALGIIRELQQRIRQIERERHPFSTSHRWTAEALSDYVRSSLPSEQLITISYRQPYTHTKTEKGLEWSTPASGLVTAIEPIMRACRGTWIAVATSDADREAADANGTLMVPPDRPSYRLKRLWLTEEQEAGFYVGFANEGVWPLCNMAYVKPRFRASDWEAYKEVNRKFADAILAEAKSSAPVVFIQDYHFGLLPKMIRERLPNALIILFWHIPWPNSEVFGILPWRKEFLEGMMAADIVGFHTQFHCNNFLECGDSYVEALIDREHDSVRRGDDLCMIRPYPISIAWPDYGQLDTPDVEDCRKWLAASLKIDSSLKIILGMERLDYIKGIPERLRAFGIFLDKNPDWRGKVCFVQVASPSRSVISAYAEIDREVEEISTEVNNKFGAGNWQPIHILKQNYGPAEVHKFYRAADACIVSSLHDGMNLVAKEYIAAREDERGVLILSEFAGSSRELVDALIVNPYDEESLAQALLRALTMSEEEQKIRMKSMREYVKSHNVYAWAAGILSDAANLHRRRQLNNMLVQMNVSATENETTEENNIVSWPINRSRPGSGT